MFPYRVEAEEDEQGNRRHAAPLPLLQAHGAVGVVVYLDHHLLQNLDGWKEGGKFVNRINGKLLKHPRELEGPRTRDDGGGAGVGQDLILVRFIMVS